MYAEITMRNTISASTALWVMSLPQVGPTFSTETDEADLCDSPARTPATLVASWVLTPLGVLGELRLDVQALLAPAPEQGDRRATEAERSQCFLRLCHRDTRSRDLP